MYGEYRSVQVIPEKLMEDWFLLVPRYCIWENELMYGTLMSGTKPGNYFQQPE
jgi:hypothetical protein